MVSAPADAKDLLHQLATLQARLEDLTARLPAHSIPPAMMIEMEEIEQAIADLSAQLGRGQQSPTDSH